MSEPAPESSQPEKSSSKKVKAPEPVAEAKPNVGEHPKVNMNQVCMHILLEFPPMVYPSRCWPGR